MYLTKKQIKKNLPKIMEQVETYCVEKLKDMPVVGNSRAVYDNIKYRY